jgi:hypothetical protein
MLTEIKAWMHEHVSPTMAKLNPGPHILASPVIGYPFRKFLEGWHKYQNWKREGQTN